MQGTSAALAILALLGVVSSASSSTCPPLPALRSPNVAGSFDPSKLDGLWYEAAYIDVAQVGSSCQTLNSSLDSASGVVTMAFRVKYGPLPFTINEVYTPQNSSSTGLYTKTAKMPGGKFLKLATAFVDVTESSDGSRYETMTIFSCLESLGVRELIFATRHESFDPSTLASMEIIARKQGVTWDSGSLNIVNRTAEKC